MKKKEVTYSTDGQVANLFYLKDKEGTYQNVLKILDEYWIAKPCKKEKFAIIYTEKEMMEAKRFLAKNKIKAEEILVVKKEKNKVNGKVKNNALPL